LFDKTKTRPKFGENAIPHKLITPQDVAMPDNTHENESDLILQLHFLAFE
jgi:hypothetical protein